MAGLLIYYREELEKEVKYTSKNYIGKLYGIGIAEELPENLGEFINHKWYQDKQKR